MKLQLFLLAGTAAFAIYATDINHKLASNSKTVSTKLICDTSAYEQGFADCIKSVGADTSKSKTFVSYYTEDCKVQNKAIHCKRIRGVGVWKNGEEVNWTPCDLVTSNKDKKLCE